MVVTNVFIQDSTLLDVAGDYSHYYVAGDVNIHHKVDDIDLSPLLSIISPGAAFDSGEQASPCLHGTRKEVLQKIGRWIDAGPNAKQGRLFWLHGPAGAGKTAVAHTIAGACAQTKKLAASYFFARGRPERDSISHFVPTLAYQLSISIPEMRPFILQNFHKDPAIFSKTISSQLQSLIVEPLLSLDTQLATLVPTLIVIDGLDECKDHENQSLILGHILKLITEQPFYLRFLIVSRPEPHIQEVLAQPSYRNVSTIFSLDATRQSMRDIEIYLRSEFTNIASSPAHALTIQRAGKPWPPPRSVKLLAERSGGCFIYASTSLKFIGDQNASPVTRLNVVLKGSLISVSAFAELDKLYTQILSSYPQPDTLKRILGVILTLRKQNGKFLHLSLIAEILGIPPEELSLALRGMHSLIYHDSANLYSEVYPHHVSFSDFLFDPNRAKRFYVDSRKAHFEIIQGSLLCMKTWGEPRSIFTMAFEHCGLLYYIYDHLVWHFRGAEVHLLKAIESIKAIRADVWIPADYRADHRFDDPAQASKIISLLNNALQLMKTLGPSYQVLMEHFHTLRDMAFQRFLVSRSFTDQLLIHAIVTLFEDLDDYEHCDRGIFRLLKFEQPASPGLIFIHSVVSDAIRRPGVPEDSASASGQLKEDLRDWLLDRARSKKLFLDPEITHAYLAHGCLSLLINGRKEPDATYRHSVGNRDPVDTYARRHWAKHISHATPGDVGLLRQLRNTDRQYLFSEEYLENVDADDDSFIQNLWGSSSTVGRSSKHSSDPCWNSYRKQDYYKAKMVLKWLKHPPNPPMDLLKQWEGFCQDKEWYADLETGDGDDDEDVYTIASDDSSYLQHFREWWRLFG